MSRPCVIDKEKVLELNAQGLSPKKIAAIMGVPYVNVYNHIYAERQSKKGRKCKDCIYRSQNMRRDGNCNYIMLTGKMRGCPADDCSKFKKGERLKKERVDLCIQPLWESRHSL